MKTTTKTMVKFTVFAEHWKKWMLPLVFTFSNLLNLFFYYLGLAFVENTGRQYGFILGNVLFSVLAGLTMLYALRKERFPLHMWLAWGGVILFYTAAFASGLLTHGLSSLLFTYCKHFIVFCLPAFFIGICAAKWRTEVYLVAVLEKLSFFAFPAGLIFFNQVLFDCNPFDYGRNLGILTNMDFCYALMPLLLAHIIAFADGADLTLPVTNKKVPRPQLVRAAMVMIYWIAMYSSGNRGSIVCILSACFLLILYKLLHREPIKRAIVLSVMMVAVLLFNMYVFALPGMRWIHRMGILMEGLAQGEITTSVEDPSLQNYLDSMVAEGVLSPNLQSMAGMIADRGTLYKLALKEFLKSPVTGMGPGGFMSKYGSYPHNAPLEMLAETGLIGTLFMMALILFAICNLLVRGWKERSVQYLFLFIAAYAVQANISGSVWACSALLLALGYGLTWRPGDLEASLEQTVTRRRTSYRLVCGILAVTILINPSTFLFKMTPLPAVNLNAEEVVDVISADTIRTLYTVDAIPLTDEERAQYQEIVFSWLGEDLWNERDAYDAAHNLMIPMQYAFASEDEVAIAMFAAFFARFAATEPRAHIQFMYLCSQYMVLCAAYGRDELIPARLLEKARVSAELYLSGDAIWGIEPSALEHVRQIGLEKDYEYHHYSCFADWEAFSCAILCDLHCLNKLQGKDIDPFDAEVANLVYQIYSSSKHNQETEDGGWLFQVGGWSDHPDFAYAGHETTFPGMEPKSRENIVDDSSHFHRHPLWLRSFQSAQPTEERWELFALRRNQLANQMVGKVLKNVDGWWLTTTYMDGANGVFRYSYNIEGVGISGYQLSSTLLCGWWSILQDSRITEVYRETLHMMRTRDPAEMAEAYSNGGTTVREVNKTLFRQGGTEVMVLCASKMNQN